MTPVQTIPNIEAIVCDYLRAHPDITERVRQQAPANKNTPWIEVVKLDVLDDPDVQVEYFLNWMVQLDCYAGRTVEATPPDGTGGPAAAINLGLKVRAVLKAMQGTTQGGAAIRKVGFLSMPRIPDVAGDREILTCLIYGRAA